MPVNGGKPIGVGNIECVAIPNSLYRYPAHIAIGGGMYFKAFFAAGFYIKACMKMVCPQFSKVARKRNGYIQRAAEIVLWVGLRIQPGAVN